MCNQFSKYRVSTNLGTRCELFIPHQYLKIHGENISCKETEAMVKVIGLHLQRLRNKPVKDVGLFQSPSAHDPLL